MISSVFSFCSPTILALDLLAALLFLLPCQRPCTSELAPSPWKWSLSFSDLPLDQYHSWRLYVADIAKYTQRVGGGRALETPHISSGISVTRVVVQANMDTSMVLSSVECRPRASTFDPRQTLVQDFDMSLSLLSASSLAYPMNYSDTNVEYHFEAAQALRLNPFYTNTAQQPFFIAQSYALAQDIPEVREARNAVANVGGSPVIKAEDGSSAKDPPAFGGFSAHNSQTPSVGQGIEFGTDVDTLMRAIQTKSGRRPPKAQNMVGFHSNGRRICDSGTFLRRHANVLEQERSNQASRKKYTCTVPSCAKMFFQKTHLEIHLRAHTGCKPFVSDYFAASDQFIQC